MRAIQLLRTIGIAEGISFLLLLLIAMPLKYFFGFPLAVKVVGWAHGALFILYIVVVLIAIRPMKWKFADVIVALVASLIPAGTLLLDRSWKKRQRALQATLG
jgi:integral membrane protein